jgi:hypothetical protein
MAYPNSSFSIRPVPPTLAAAGTLRVIEESAIEDSVLAPLLWLRQPISDQSLHPNGVPAPSNSVTAASTQPGATAENEAQNAEEDARTLSFLQDPCNHYRLVTDTATNTPIAFVWWQYCKGQTDSQWAEKYSNRWRPELMNKALADATGGVQFLKRAKLLGDQDFFSAFH